jgi:ribosomal-protein-alanine N-acetyltransferase
MIRKAPERASPRVEIARFQLRHLKRILEIEQAAFPEEPYDREIFLDLYQECPELFLIAKISRRIAGYIAVSMHSKKAEVISIGVEPARRRQGAASALLSYALAWLKARGCRQVELMVRKDNEPALRFYRNFGFRRIGEAPRYYKGGHTGIKMRRKLAAGRFM